MVDQGFSAGDVPSDKRVEVRRAIARLAVPMALADVVDLLVVVGVVALMGRMGDESLYVRALYLPVGYLFIAVYTAFEISNQVAASISRGRGRPQDVVPAALSFARIWLAVGVVITALVTLCAPLVADAFSVPPESRTEFTSFLRWMAAAEMTHVGVLLCASSLRGYGHARGAAIVMLLNAAVHFGGVALLGLGMRIGAASVPVAIVAASVTGWLIGMFLLRRTGLWRPGQTPRWHHEVVRHLGAIGVPVATTHLILLGGSFGVLWLLSEFGPGVVSGYSSANNLQTLMLMPGIVLGSAIAIVINQQRGAGRNGWIPGTLTAGLQITFGLYLAIGILAWLGSGLLGGLMTETPFVAAEISTYLSIVGLTFLLHGPVLACLGVMEQVGYGLLAVILNLTYYAAVIFFGAIVVRSTLESDALYRTIAVCNCAGSLVIVAAVLVVGRMSRVDRPIAGMAER